jgi:hypothetical protein
VRIVPVVCLPSAFSRLPRVGASGLSRICSALSYLLCVCVCACVCRVYVFVCVWGGGGGERRSGKACFVGELERETRCRPTVAHNGRINCQNLQRHDCRRQNGRSFCQHAAHLSVKIPSVRAICARVVLKIKPPERVLKKNLGMCRPYHGLVVALRLSSCTRFPRTAHDHSNGETCPEAGSKCALPSDNNCPTFRQTWGPSPLRPMNNVRLREITWSGRPIYATRA